MIMKKYLPILLGALGVASAVTPVAAAPLSANAAVTTDYVFRGISQGAGNPAVQAGLDYDLGMVTPGLAVGTWVSSIDFGDDTPIEWDLYASYSGSITDEFGYSFGAIGYVYPSSPHGVSYNWWEMWGGLSYNFGPLSVSGKIYYSPDYVNLTTHEIYYTGGISVPVADWLSFNANIGHTDLGHSVFPLIKDYTDWNLNVAATYDNYTLTLGYTGTSGLDGAYRVNVGPFQTTAQFYAMVSFKLP
jgi:uncharacterized protein (TIGR02001 family)